MTSWPVYRLSIVSFWTRWTDQHGPHRCTSVQGAGTIPERKRTSSTPDDNNDDHHDNHHDENDDHHREP